MNFDKKPSAADTDKTHQLLASVGRQMAEVRMATLDASRTMNTTVGSEGGFAVPEEEMRVLTDLIFDRSYLLNRVRRFSVKRTSLKVVMPDETAGGNFAGIKVETIPEMGDFPITLLKTRAARIGLHKDGCAFYASEEMTEDGDNSFALLGESVAIEMRRKMERTIWRGTGAGQGLGVVNAPSLITQAIEGGQGLSNTAAHIGTNAAKMVAQAARLGVRCVLRQSGSPDEPAVSHGEQQRKDRADAAGCGGPLWTHRHATRLPELRRTSHWHGG